MNLTHPQNVFKKREKVNMSDDDLVRRLRGETMPFRDLRTTRRNELLYEAASHIEKLERDVLKYSSAVADAQMRNEELDRALNRIIDRWEAQKARIEKLEAALRCIEDEDNYGSDGCWVADSYPDEIARKALEGKDD
jgi:DNA repair ATPase RecN